MPHCSPQIGQCSAPLSIRDLQIYPSRDRNPIDRRPVRGWVRILGKSDRSSNRLLAETSIVMPIIRATLSLLPNPCPSAFSAPLPSSSWRAARVPMHSPSEDSGRMLGMWDSHDATLAPGSDRHAPHLVP